MASSFLPVPADSHFPLANIPFGVFATKDGAIRCGTRIGDSAICLKTLQANKLLLSGSDCFQGPSLNAFMAMGKMAWSEARSTLQSLLAADGGLKDNQAVRDTAIFPIADVTMQMPCVIGDYTDFYASKEHATNVGTMFRGKENALMPNWVHLPVGYHGRASSVVLSGTPVRRPCGQTKADDAEAPSYTPCRLLDFELEMGFFVGPGNELGAPMTMQQASDSIFGMVLLNDWSARDIQKWEYVPLGPFGAKNFATSISPWIVTMDALSPFLCDGPAQEPAALPYLKQEGKTAIDVNLSVAIRPDGEADAHVVCQSNLKWMYWSIQQQLVHHTVTGCNMRPGDLLGTGTISGPEPSSYGSMLELSWRGSNPVAVGKATRKFLADGDDVVMSGYCEASGVRIGFGEVTGKVLPAVPFSG
jgi:fumarylacetoacetase